MILNKVDHSKGELAIDMELKTVSYRRGLWWECLKLFGQRISTEDFRTMEHEFSLN
jgi:hypothetical protein